MRAHRDGQSASLSISTVQRRVWRDSMCRGSALHNTAKLVQLPPPSTPTQSSSGKWKRSRLCVVLQRGAPPVKVESQKPARARVSERCLRNPEISMNHFNASHERQLTDHPSRFRLSMLTTWPAQRCPQRCTPTRLIPAQRRHLSAAASTSATPLRTSSLHAATCC